MPLHTHYSGCSLKDNQEKEVLASVWRNWNPQECKMVQPLWKSLTAPHNVKIM